MLITSAEDDVDWPGCLQWVDYVADGKQEWNTFWGPRIAWERTDIAFRGQPRRRRRSAESPEGKFRDDSQSPQAIIELDWIGEFEKAACTIVDWFRFILT